MKYKEANRLFHIWGGFFLVGLVFLVHDDLTGAYKHMIGNVLLTAFAWLMTYWSLCRREASERGNGSL
jgi:hypothetical protein